MKVNMATNMLNRNVSGALNYLDQENNNKKYEKQQQNLLK